MGGAGMMGGQGMMGGMMGHHGAMPNWTPARRRARQRRPGARAREQLARDAGDGLTAAEPTRSRATSRWRRCKDGKIAGMISVNAKTGAVFYHWWHGTFVAMEE